MKYTVRIVALLLSIVMLISPLASCKKDKNDVPAISTDDAVVTSEILESLAPSTEEATEESTAPVTEVVTEPAVETLPVTDTVEVEEEDYVFEIVYPSVSVSELKYNLRGSKLTEFKTQLKEVKSIFNKNSKESENKFKNELYELLSIKAEISVQGDIAYLNYLYDMSDSTAWNNYLRAQEMHNDAEDLLFEFYNQSKNLDNNLSNSLKEVINKEFNLVTELPSVDENHYEMERLEGEYNSLINSDATDAKVFDVYKKYIKAANAVAEGTGYENYYEYASKVIYRRNDTHAQRETLREYVKQYLVPLYRDLKANSYSIDSQLTGYEYDLSDIYLKSRFDSYGENYILDYFSSLSQSTSEIMKSAFEKDRVLIGDKETSYNNATNVNIGNTQICYFGKDKASITAVSHQLGYYYSNVVAGNSSKNYSFDLKELHAMTNSMLCYSYLSKKINNKAFLSAEVYEISNWMYQIVTSVIKDEFDEIIFTSDPSKLSINEFKGIMNGLIDEYGVGDFSSSIVTQLTTYWRRLGIEYAMRNYYYATAMMTSFQIYMKSKSDYASACEMYRIIVEEIQNEGDYVSTIVKAGLTTPYERQTYIDLKNLKYIH